MNPAAESAAAAQPQTRPDSPVLPCPILFALEVMTLGEDESPVAGIALELSDGGRALHARTASDGVARFEGLADASYRLSPYELDVEAWTLVREEALPPELERSGTPALWEDCVPHPAAAAGHSETVARNGSVDRLALDHGLFPDAIWNHPRNGELRRRRESRNVLLEDDAVFIPAIRRHQISVEVGNRYILRRRGVPSRVRIRLFDDLRPLDQLAWTLRVDGEATRQGTTDASGVLETWVPASASAAVLSFVAHGRTRDVTIALGTLTPAREPGGWRQRLRNLGFRCDSGDAAALSADDRGALRRFQVSWGLPVTGEPDAATIVKIHAVHDGGPTDSPQDGLYGPVD